MIFKLLALRINSDFPLQKNLKKNLLYKFSRNFIFLNEHGDNLTSVKDYREIKKIEDRSTYPKDLYSIKKKNDQSLSINISAILGRNGAGKSSLLEMIYLLIFCLAEKRGETKHRQFIEEKIKSEPLVERWKSLLTSTNQLLDTTDLEIYYQTPSGIYLIKKTPKQTTVKH